MLGRVNGTALGKTDGIALTSLGKVDGTALGKTDGISGEPRHFLQVWFAE